MNTSERRKQILDIISQSNMPIPGARLAEDSGVSRQIIVSDISALKESHDIIATSKGYILQKKKSQRSRRPFGGVPLYDFFLDYIIILQYCQVSVLQFLHIPIFPIQEYIGILMAGI